MSTYGWILLGTILFPFLFSFERRLAYVRRWPAVLGATLLVAVPFLTWDVWATQGGHWWFAHEHVAGLFWLGLPLEEFLFFVAAPFSCLFIHAAFQSAFPSPVPPRARRWPWLLLGVAALVLAVFAWPRPYTTVVLVFLGLFLAVAPWLWSTTFFSRAFWWAQGVSMVPFLVVNGVLTALPVVSYSPAAILGPRIFTIPVEDAVYSFVLVGLNIAVSEALRKGRLGIRT